MLVRYRLWEYERDRPHVIAGWWEREVELEQVLDFHAWAAEHWPAPRWRTELLPGQMPRLLNF